MPNEVLEVFSLCSVCDTQFTNLPIYPITPFSQSVGRTSEGLYCPEYVDF